MRLGLFALTAALLLAAVAGQNSLLQASGAQDETSAITACAVQGESCAQPPLDSSPGSSVAMEHLVLSAGCQSSDLHLVRYLPADGAGEGAVVARWCS